MLDSDPLAHPTILHFVCKLCGVLARDSQRQPEATTGSPERARSKQKHPGTSQRQQEARRYSRGDAEYSNEKGKALYTKLKEDESYVPSDHEANLQADLPFTHKVIAMCRKERLPPSESATVGTRGHAGTALVGGLAFFAEPSMHPAENNVAQVTCPTFVKKDTKAYFHFLATQTTGVYIELRR